MGGLKNLGRVLVLTALCGLIWWTYSAKEQVNQMEREISNQYFYANSLLRNTVDELLEWNFSQPLTDAVEDKDYLYELFAELDNTTSLIFSGYVVHHEWRSRMYDILNYIHRYIMDSSLSEEDVADLHQALRATLFITMDLKDTNDYYEAMHDEKHEMVKQVKSRLNAQY
ncbi:hypothetical protein LZ480_12435 [Solibacillus sp. MA9]|uniref:Uncharacterized protein n=1 Tax=Solibacillus palustris TaxID=2908203 RepID=A0ABS9UEC9_9BACL|nr:hypothetical protein [Solibacillus sp. MA9]MCH7322698.1 hypothetical protein [Solibacillus sp. MA9]